jgi:hypothetical protein
MNSVRSDAFSSMDRPYFSESVDLVLLLCDRLAFSRASDRLLLSPALDRFDRLVRLARSRSGDRLSPS